MINSHLLYRLSYRGTTVRILLIQNTKSSICAAASDGSADRYHSTAAIAFVTVSRLLRFRAATQIRPVETA